MTEAAQQPVPIRAPDEIDLLALAKALLRFWWLVALVTAVGTWGAWTYARRAAPVYRAQASLAPPQQKRSGAASAALTAFGGFGAEIAGSLGVSLGGADASRLAALLESHRLLERVVTRHDLLPVLFPDRWDAGARAWRPDPKRPPPGVWDAEALLRERYKVGNDLKTGVLNVTLEFGDPATAQAILAHVVDELALLLQEDEVARVEADRRFVDAELRRAADPFIVSKLQALLSDTVERSMMARNLRHSAFELIDPPAASSRRVRPNRPLIVGLGVAASFVSGLLCALAAVWVRGASPRPIPQGGQT